MSYIDTEGDRRRR